MQTPSGTIANVDTEVDSFIGAFGAGANQDITWSFAKGVGFTTYQDGTYNLTLQSFSLTASCIAQP